MERKLLSPVTHALCRRALSGEFGKAMTQHYCAIVAEEDFARLSPWQQYNACLEAIVEQCSIRLTDTELLAGSATLEIKLSHATVRGEEGLEGLVDLLYAFCSLGCHFMQPDVVDAQMLRQAQEDPERYGDLVVRVSGWSSRFRTLERQWQELVIQRTESRY